MAKECCCDIVSQLSAGLGRTMPPLNGSRKEADRPLCFKEHEEFEGLRSFVAAVGRRAAEDCDGGGGPNLQCKKKQASGGPAP